MIGGWNHKTLGVLNGNGTFRILSYCFNHFGCTSYLTLAAISSYFILNLIWQSPKTLFDEMESQQFMFLHIWIMLDDPKSQFWWLMIEEFPNKKFQMIACQQKNVG